MTFRPLVMCIVLCLPLLGDLRASADEREDVLVADFEGEDYGSWNVAGEAFGPGPARGTLPNQMHVDGFLGERLVNSFFHGDDTTGTLTSPPIKVERRFVNFLIGGGKYPGETCINLLLDGEVFRTATGPNDVPGGSERLDWQSWDVSDLAGKSVTLQIVDQRKGGWGHISVDHIVQSDQRRQVQPARRELVVEQRYLHLPVKTGASKRRLKFLVHDRVVREFEIELADSKPDFWVFSDVGEFHGQTLTIDVDRAAGPAMLSSIGQADSPPDAEQLYHEQRRPQFHFTSRRGWLNDPNGLVYYDGEYHLFYQHNPYGWNWGNMHWGHAVSDDLVHWQELPEALYPQRFGDWCFSGSALVDRGNTSGWRTGDEQVLVAAYTSTGRGESMAYSNDRGRTWTEFADNPVVKHRGRDPKIIWHQPTERWLMAVYDETDHSRAIAFYTSPNLKRWQLESRIEGFYECPDLFELPVDGDARNTQWVLYAADGKYLLGEFDGREFHPRAEKQQLWYGNFYAAQTYSNTPDGRRIQIGWGRGITFPDMPFNQQMTVPVELTLRTTAGGIRMFAKPVGELAKLRRETYKLTDVVLRPDDNPLAEIKGELFDVRAEFEVGKAVAVGMTIRGVPVVYDVEKQQVTCQDVSAPLLSDNGKLRMRILADRGSIEIFGGDGRVALSIGVTLPEDTYGLDVFARGGEARISSLEISELQSAW